ncbi:MAG: methylenetetrahydrofolate--tRNA-(uracil(54)-C(5))-methyltransferase (FADH(2)-oxidizing) TrmFO [Bdellovibrionia bacterium]
MSSLRVHIIGGGLAGSEAAYFLAEKGISVILHEMRPQVSTPAHQTDKFAELVCSNSFKSKAIESAPGILKNEMSRLNSLILRAASSASVPSGEALGVDREVFSDTVTRALRSHSHITLANEEVSEPPAKAITLIATGPLTSDSLSQWISKVTPQGDFYFYDAIAPIVDASSLDYTQCFFANRYGKGGEEAYLNCPLNETQYNQFIDALLAAEKVPPQRFEKEKFFQGCQPIEAIAATGRESLRFGPMKPVGLEDPKTGSRAHAILQLRPENLAKTAYNLVGFQTKLKYPEQSKVFRLIPALQHAEFLRLGSIHRNTYLCGPKVLRADLSLKGHPQVYFAGQITGVEGYLESAACGLLAALFILQRLQGQPHSPPPANTALGALLRHVTGSDPERYGPSNIHFGLLDPVFFKNLEGKKKEETRKLIAEQADRNFSDWKNSQQMTTPKEHVH